MGATAGVSRAGQPRQLVHVHDSYPASRDMASRTQLGRCRARPRPRCRTVSWPIRAHPDPVDTLWDLLLPDEARHLPQDFDEIHQLLTDARP